MSHHSSNQTTDGNLAADYLNTFILGLAAVLTAWSVFQSTLWSGKESFMLAEAGLINRSAIRYELEGRQTTMMDMVTFIDYIEAHLGNETERKDFHRERFRPEMQQAFERWIATDPFNSSSAPSHPFDMPEYTHPEELKSDALRKESLKYYRLASQYNDAADGYMLATVFLAMVLFFGGIAGRTQARPIRRILITISLLWLLASAIQISTKPVTWQGKEHFDPALAG